MQHLTRSLIPIVSVFVLSKVVMVLSILQDMLDPIEDDKTKTPEFIENCFAYAIVWAFGGLFIDDKTQDNATMFDEIFQSNFGDIIPVDEDDEGNTGRQVVKFRGRGFEALNTDDISDTLIKLADDIQTQIDKSYLSSSNTTIDTIDNYNSLRYIIRQERVVILSYLNGFHQKKACINIKNEDKRCFKYCVQCSVLKSMRKTILNE